MPRIFCLLPAARAQLAGAISAAGGVPVIDLTTGEATVVPTGAWVRVRSTAGVVPGGAGVFAAVGQPLAGRETWIEGADAASSAEQRALGFAGVCVRGRGSGGESGTVDVRDVQTDMACVFDWPFGPEALPTHDILLSDVLLAYLDPPKKLVERLARITPADLRRVDCVTLVASLASPALRRIAGGEPPELAAAGLWADGDAFAHALLAGEGALLTTGLKERFPTLGDLVGAYLAAAPQLVRARQAPTAVVPVTAPENTGPEPIAIIGIGCRLPGASNATELWTRLLEGWSAIIEVPPHRWEHSLYWDADHNAPDRTYSKIGGFITDFKFNPRRFRIPPSVVPLIDGVQQLALEAAADALEDAGYGNDRTFDRERVAVILGQSMGGEMTDKYAVRIFFPAVKKALAEVPDFASLPFDRQVTILEEFERVVKASLPPVTEDSMPGELANVTAGRVANALNLGGANFTTDAACAGSMAAIQSAVKGLQDHDFDLALSGGSDRSMAPPTYVKFSKIGALSADGSCPFDDAANGFVMGEGCGVVVLKRLGDAVRDGDRVYAIIRSIGASSDGKGKGITAPNPEGQRRALRRAYDIAGVDPGSVDLFECHGTSTHVGDKVEVEALGELVAGRRTSTSGPARIGSIKSNIGHLKAAAGSAATIKATLAIFHKTFPASINCKQPRKDVDFNRGPLQVQTKTEPWEVAAGARRRAGVSAFGFGGTNFHILLEEYRAGDPVRTPVTRTAAVDAAPPVEAPFVPPPRGTAPTVTMAPRGMTLAPVRRPVEPPKATGERGVAVPTGIWAVSADTPEELIARCRALKRGESQPYEPDAPLRVAAAAENAEERASQLDKVIQTVQKGKGYDLLRQRGIHLEDVPCDGQLAFVFTGQGSQYIDMGLDLAEQYPIVKATFEEADRVMAGQLGRPLTEIIRRDPSLTEDEQFDRLRQTEISQPATLTIDVAILRLLASYGVRPDVVAGHSLGEYGAAVAAGMLTFQDALIAVSARGREMAAVKLPDFGKMAGVATSVETVEAVLAEIPGYVVAANKNCPTQTVIAGESEAVEAAIEAFRSRGLTVHPLPVSHAFHSRIVAPASEPLRRVLAGLDLREPRRRITTNVNSRYYPVGAGARDAAIDILARQVASPVEWIAQIERMYADGARIFVECGPKRALAGFVVNILKHRPHRSLYTNQPKRGGVLSFLDALAGLYALGFPVTATSEMQKPWSDEALFAANGVRRSTTAAMEGRAQTHPQVAPEEGRAEDAVQHGAPAIEREILKIVAAKTGWPVEMLDINFDLEADLGIDTVKLADIVASVREHFRLEHDPNFRLGDYRTLRQLIDYAGQRVGSTRPVGVPARRPAVAVVDAPAGDFGGDAIARFLGDIASKDLGGLDAPGFAAAMLPAVQALLAASWQAFNANKPEPTVAPVEAARPLVAVARPVPASPTLTARDFPAEREGRAFDPLSMRIVCSGASLGLPAGDDVFAPDNIQRMLDGENRIVTIALGTRQAMADKDIRRLVKNPQTGEGEFVRATTAESVIQLAGVKAHFDLAADYGVDETVVRTLDVTTQLAFAAGLEALRDAGIPLVRNFREASNGKRVATGWVLPPSMRDDTGIIFASAFPGYDQLISKVLENAKTTEPDGTVAFDRRFLFQVLAMGHSQFAQFIGARGPNTQVNAACASTTQAIAIGEDWIRLGRCKRVIVVGADDVTNDVLMPWIGSGFLAAGAATVNAKVEEAALPFDRRRHGMILGMGAVGIVLERAEDVAARGMAPVAELIGTHITNSAFHGTRLDADHITREVQRFAAEVLKRTGETAERFASRCVFLSHETYTPARGGSAAAEMASLPAAFGPAASQIVIANTKGYTGHPMGAGIEDTVAVKALQYRRVPPIANLKEPDPDLGTLRLSTGGSYPVDYAFRLAAGFGSQLALAAWKRAADGDNRVVDSEAYDAWLAEEGVAVTKIELRQLRSVPLGSRTKPPGTTPRASRAPLGGAPTPPPPVQATAPIAPAPVAAPVSVGMSAADMLTELLAVVAKRTGYEVSELDPTYELEADLGVDTVKQAEIFGEMRERHGIARDDTFKLADYPTIVKLAGYLAGRVGVAGVAPETAPAKPAPSAAQPEDDDESTRADTRPTAQRSLAPATITLSPVETAPAPSGESVLDVLLAVVARRTGYEVSELDPTFELEADLGIDTVKQAEIFGEVREKFGIGRDDGFRLADYPTIEKLAAWLASKATTGAPAAGAEPATAVAPPEPAAVPEPAAAPQETPDDAAFAVDAEPPRGEHISLHPEASVAAADVLDTLDVLDAEEGPEDPLASIAAQLTVATTLAPASGNTVASVLVGLPSASARTSGVGRRDYIPDMDAAGLPADPPHRVASLPPSSASTLAPSGPFRAPSIPPRSPTASVPPSAAPTRSLPPAPARVSIPPSAPVAPTTIEARARITPRSPSGASLPPTPSKFATLGPFGLPELFRIRRPLRVSRPPTGTPAVAGRKVEVLGEGWLAVALRMEIERRGGVSELEPGQIPDSIIDAGAAPIEAFRRARELAATPPKHWLCVLQSSSHAAAQVANAAAGLKQCREQGARAGVAKALGREWADCDGRVVRLDPALTPELAARAALEELAETDGALEAWRTLEGREVSILDLQAFPTTSGSLPLSPVVLLTGGTRGITAKVASAIAMQGPCTLVLVARSLPGALPLEEGIEKARIKQELSAAGLRATPKQIDDALRPLRTAEEARRTVNGLKMGGAKVDVRICSLGDPAAVKQLIADVVATHGRIDACIHGAGVEESRPIADKDDAAWHRVYDGKAEGGLALCNELPESTYFLSMGSIAGRFGNPGQVDYTAANEAMAQVCLARPRSLHVCWTAWGDVGMAVRGGMDTLLTERGVELLPAGPGARLTVAMMEAGMTGEVVVAGKLGGFPLPALHPLADSVAYEGDAVVVRRSMTQASDPWMADHAIDGVWVLPGVIGLELMVAAAMLACPHGEYAGAENVKFAAPLKLHGDEPVDVEIRATPVGDGTVRCTLQSSRSARTGRKLTTAHFEALVHVEEMPMLPALPSMFLPDEPIASREIYRRFFHGQSFQVLRSAEAVALQGLFAEARVEHATIAEGLLTDPLVLEAAFQAAGLHRMAIHGVMALPSAIDVLERSSPVVEGDTLNVMVHLRQGPEGGDLYDIDVDGTNGRVLRVRGFRLIDRGPLLPGENLPVPEGGWASVASATTADSGELPPGDVQAMTARGLPHRQADRLAGQTAARRAVSALLGHDDYAIERLPSGAPVVHDTRGDDVHVSISHRNGEAWAVASHAPVGIDVEAVAPHSAAFLADWYTPEECGDPGDRDVTVRWAIKEAVLKRLGVGMAATPREVVTACVDGAWSAKLGGELSERYGAQRFAVSVSRRGELVGVVLVEAPVLMRRSA